MKRGVAVFVLVVFLLQSGGSAFAGTPRNPNIPPLHMELVALAEGALSSLQ